MKTMKCKVLNHVNQFQTNTQVGAAPVTAQMPALGGSHECGLTGQCCSRAFYEPLTELYQATDFTSRRNRMGRDHGCSSSYRGLCNHRFCIRSRSLRNRIRSDVCKTDDIVACFYCFCAQNKNIDVQILCTPMLIMSPLRC